MNKSSLLPVTFAVASVYIGYFSPAMAMGRCPTEEERLANAEIVVEAGVKSIFVGDSGFLDEDANPIRIMRADLDVRTVLKGKFTGNAATVYDEAYDSALGPLDALSTMASLYSASGGYTLTVELSRQKAQ